MESADRQDSVLETVGAESRPTEQEQVSQGNDERLANREAHRPDREDRATTQNRNVTDIVRGAERRAMLRDTDTLLPPPPVVEGYHSFWATTTNTKDTVENRQRQGYTYITRQEAPDFQFDSLKSGETTSDRIMVNEMVAMKLPLELWKEDMMYLHHELPVEQMKKLKDIEVGEDGRGNKIGWTGGDFRNGRTEGFDALGRVLPPNLKGVA